MLFYRALLPPARQTLAYVTGVVRRDRATPSTRWHRALPPDRQALMMPVYLRKGETFTAPAVGFAVSTATAWRYVHRTMALLAAACPNSGPRCARRCAVMMA
ncbi:helix-turn-helix domain-containing protein [Actinomadura kijaniata]|uniref:helix-turn-helix domain-containing protein n=1 Tax=Actinomadura kijaniata TaxID=46161 RepID=UPI003F1E300E